MFKINLTKKPAFDGVIKRELEYDGLKLTLVVKAEEDFYTAVQQVSQLQEAEKNQSTKEKLKRGYTTSFEAAVFLVGEYAIGAWNVEDHEGKPVEPNGDNLMLVIGSLENAAEFLKLLMESFNDCVLELTNKVSELKKKSQNVSGGKKQAKNLPKND